jgi:hypothetical protein
MKEEEREKGDKVSQSYVKSFGHGTWHLETGIWHQAPGTRNPKPETRNNDPYFIPNP